MKFTFSTPEEYIAWIEAQHEALQVRIVRTTEQLLNLGLPGQVAAELVYQTVQKSLQFSTTKH